MRPLEPAVPANTAREAGWLESSSDYENPRDFSPNSGDGAGSVREQAIQRHSNAQNNVLGQRPSSLFEREGDGGRRGVSDSPLKTHHLHARSAPEARKVRSETSGEVYHLNRIRKESATRDQRPAGHSQTIASETHVSALSQNLPTHPHLSGGKKSDGQSMDEYGLDMTRQA